MIFVNFRSLWLLGFEVMYTGIAIKNDIMPLHFIWSNGMERIGNHTNQQIPAFLYHFFS